VSTTEIQKRVDAVRWFHEFDFGNGIVAQSTGPDLEMHRNLWAFMRRELDAIDFSGKTVLDIGCWDGYWSFYAERRGAAQVLAADDRSQNWGSSGGVELAKELLNSSIEIDLNRSVYRLEELGRKFDILLCLGVYYHLIDPFFAFAQIRHCCHEETLVLFEGDVTFGIPPNTFFYDLSNRIPSCFIPTNSGLLQMLKAAYFDVVKQSWHARPKSPSLRQRLRIYSEAFRELDAERAPLPGKLGRVMTYCRPVETQNAMHICRPPFDLDRYDPRFGSAAAEL
jgi:tRNA (mo5U34)-methyltransferase